MVAAWQVMANAKPAAGTRLWADPRFLWTSLALAGLLLLLALIIAWLRSWKEHSEPEPLSANDQLAHFRELYEKGELSQVEVERIRTKLARQLQQELDITAKPTGPASQETQPPGAAGGKPPPA